MATAWRIEQADRKYDSKPAQPRFDDAILLGYLATPEMEEAERRAAALWVADFFAASHGCNRTKKRRCTKPEHAGDVEQVREWLGAFGLVEDEPEPVEAEEEPQPVQPARPKTVVDWRWAACKGEEIALFFTADNEQRAAREEREAEAKTVCGWCPIREECLDYAVENDIRYGMWGGQGEEERQEERRRAQRRAQYERQRKAAAA